MTTIKVSVESSGEKHEMTFELRDDASVIEVLDGFRSTVVFENALAQLRAVSKKIK